MVRYTLWWKLLVVAMVLLALTAHTETLVLQPGSEGKDTYICDCLPGVNNPNGPITHLYQGQYGACYDRMLIQWDLSVIPEDMVITSAIMELFTFGFYGSISGSMKYYRITEDWEETGVTYNTQPAYFPAGSITEDWPTGANQWHEVDITPWVQGWYDGTFDNCGIYGHCAGTSGTCCIGFDSSDHSTAEERPKLTISYYDPNAVHPVEERAPATFSLEQNYPNPFNPKTTLTFKIPIAEQSSLIVYDIDGREIDRLVDSYLPAGVYQTQFDGTHLPSGIYIYELHAGINSACGKMLLTK